MSYSNRFAALTDDGTFGQYDSSVVFNNLPRKKDMQPNTLSTLQPSQQNAATQPLERAAVRPKIERKPGEPFDVRKADIEIQARWVMSDIGQSH